MDSEGRHPSSAPGGDKPTPRPATGLLARIERYAQAVRDGDQTTIEEALLQLSQSRRMFAPLAFVVGGVATLFDGVKLLFTNWRLTLVQILPAMWIWIAMLDWKAHALHGQTFHVLRGPILIPLVLAVAAATAASFFLNAVFGFAITGPAPPHVRPAFAIARTHLSAILVPGAIVGLLLGFSAFVVTRWGSPWFGISMGAVCGVMMVCYVAVPARLIGVKPNRTRREKLTLSAVGGAMGAIICTPPYLLGRLAILMLGNPALLIPSILLLAFAVTLQAGATGAVKAVKMSTKLGAAPIPKTGDEPASPDDTP